MNISISLWRLAGSADVLFRARIILLSFGNLVVRVPRRLGDHEGDLDRDAHGDQRKLDPRARAPESSQTEVRPRHPLRKRTFCPYPSSVYLDYGTERPCQGSERTC